MAAMSSSEGLFLHLVALFLVLGLGSTQDVQVDGVKQLGDDATDQKNTTHNTTQNEASYEVKEQRKLGPEEGAVKAPTNSMGIPDFSLIEDNKVCLRASFESRIVIKYRTVGTSKTKVLETDTQLPKDAAVSGNCGDLTHPAVLQLTWEAFTMKLVFGINHDEEKAAAEAGEEKPIVMTWSAQEISMLINTTDPRFHSPVSSGVHEVQTTSGTHFNTPANFSFSCLSEQELELHETGNDTTINAVTLAMWSTQIQAFQLPADGQFKQAAKCVQDISIPEQNVVPIAVAACLAILILIIIIVYLVMRQTSKLNYRAME